VTRRRPRGVRAGAWLPLALLGGALAVGAGARAGGPPDLLVTVGDVRQQTAVIWARAPEPGPVTLEVAPAGRPREGRWLQAQATLGTDLTVRLRADRLRAATAHTYRVTAAGRVVDGEFRTAPEPRVVQPLTLVWSGDLGGACRCRSPGSGYPIFRTIAERRPDLFVFVGDTIYADHRCRVPENVPGADFRAVDLPGFRAKHRYNRADPAVQDFFRRTAVWAIWDDHEVRNDFAGPSEPLMASGRRAFLEYWPIDTPPENPYRLHRRLRWGRLVELFILDTRQYRSPNQIQDGPEKTMLGAEQREWLLAGLVGSEAVWKLVVSSVPLSVPTGRTVRDSWANGSLHLNAQGSDTGFEHELGRIVRHLAEHRVPNIVWLVGDVHRAEVIRHAPAPGLVFHELIAGPLSASLGRPGALDDTLHPTRLFGDGGYYNFGELRAMESGLEVRIVDAEGRVRFETTLAPER
jgi:alkaline phosphatase D